MRDNEELRIGVYVCSCGSNIGGVIDPGEVAEFASHLPGVVLSKQNLYMCGDPGQNLIRQDINIREQNTWVHSHEPEAALLKAKEMVAAAVAKVRHVQPLQPITVPVTKKAMVIGAGVAGISAALDLADMGIPTYLVEKQQSIGGTMGQLNKTFPTMDCSI